MVRVLHHIVNQKVLFHEIERVMKNDGIFILEYANKMHIKARIRWLLKGQFKNFSTLPYQQPSQGHFEGAGEGENAIFLNFHPRNITTLLHKFNFKILKKTNCSFFRINFLKKHLPFGILIGFEKIFQKLFSWTNFSPSIVLKTTKTGRGSEKHFEKFEDILCCPKCKEGLEISKEKANCKNCKKNI